MRCGGICRFTTTITQNGRDHYRQVNQGVRGPLTTHTTVLPTREPSRVQRLVSEPRTAREVLMTTDPTWSHLGDTAICPRANRLGEPAGSETQKRDSDQIMLCSAREEPRTENSVRSESFSTARRQEEREKCIVCTQSAPETSVSTGAANDHSESLATFWTRGVAVWIFVPRSCTRERRTTETANIKGAN